MMLCSQTLQRAFHKNKDRLLHNHGAIITTKIHPNNNKMLPNTYSIFKFSQLSKTTICLLFQSRIQSRILLYFQGLLFMALIILSSPEKLSCRKSLSLSDSFLIILPRFIFWQNDYAGNIYFQMHPIRRHDESQSHYWQQ